MIPAVFFGGAMALTTCPECGQQVSDHATQCPHCGHPFERSSPAVVHVEKNSHPVLTVVGGAVIVLGVLAFIGKAFERTPVARFNVTDVLSDEGCTVVGDYCVNVHCTFQNVGDTAGALRVRARLLEKSSQRVLADHATDLTLLQGASQRVTFAFAEAEIDRPATSVCSVDEQ